MRKFSSLGMGARWRSGVPSPLRNFGLILGLVATLVAAPGAAAAERETLVAKFAAAAKADDPAFDGFSAERGKAFSLKRFSQGSPKTPSCTTCHTASPKRHGETRAGKPIAPMAVSVTPDRYTDPRKVAKWFRRNCRSVLGRLCTAREKGDYLTYMMSQ